MNFLGLDASWEYGMRFPFNFIGRVESSIADPSGTKSICWIWIRKITWDQTRLLVFQKIALIKLKKESWKD